MNSTHPKALEALARAKERADRRVAEKSLVADLTKQGVRFLEIEPEGSYDDKGRLIKPKHGRMTLAYFSVGRSIITVSTAICHPNDQFDKLTGRAIAGVNLATDRCIALRKPTSCRMTMKQWLSYKFTEMGE